MKNWLDDIKKYYNAGLWTDGMVNDAVVNGKITAAQYEEITGTVATADLATIKAAKVTESKEDLGAYLIEHPMTWTDGNQYSATAEKQSLLTSQLALYQTAQAAGQPYTLKWNTTGGECTEWTYENMVALALAIGAYVQPLVSYQQAKEVAIMACDTVEALDAIKIDYATLS